jgi:hypothetical protein
MQYLFRLFLFLAVIFSLFLFTEFKAHAEPVKMTSSTQFLWGDDLLGEHQAIIAQYLRFGFTPEGKKYSLTGYGRISKDLGSGDVYDTDLQGRLYYLYLDYVPVQNMSLRLGRQFLNFTAASAILDGATVDISKIGPVGITIAAGRDVRFSLDSEHTRDGNYFAGIDVHLQGIKATQLGISYARKWDKSDLAREAVGMNFRYFFKQFSPYAEVRYDTVSEAIDEATAGLDFFPTANLMIKGEFYHAYPTFDATSIYSVFAVEKFREYLIRAEYNLNAPVNIFASYARQTYDGSDDADLFRLGTRIFPTDNLTLTTAVDYRNGYGGNLWGFEVFGDYRIRNKFLVSAGAQYDSYRRPAFEDDDYDHARRFWIGGKWLVTKNVAASVRIEDNVNENFNHRPLGRLTLTWTL